MINKIKHHIKRRHTELDVARGIAIFLMILQHAWLMFSNEKVANSLLGSIIILLGTVPAAPVFLFLTGINIINSRNSSPEKLLKRGLILFGFGYLFSALRFYLPIVLGYKFGIVDPAIVAYQFSPIDYLLQVDVFQVTGLSLMGIALLKYFKIKHYYYLVIAILISLVSPYLWQINFSNIFISRLFDPFFGTGKYVIFPFFPWFFYPLVGVYFGDLLSKTKNKTKFYKQSLLWIIPIVIIGGTSLVFSRNWNFPVYSHHSFGASLLFVSFVIGWLALIYIQYYKLSINVRNKLIFWSQNVTLIYIIQWLVIAWLAVFGNFHVGFLPLIILTVIIFKLIDYLVSKLRYYYLFIKI